MKAKEKKRTKDEIIIIYEGVDEENLYATICCRGTFVIIH